MVRLDATLIQAASDKDGAEPNFKGYGFHPLTAWCSNVGDVLAAMLRPGSAGSFTASDHIAVVDAAIAQLPPHWRGDVLVTVDGAGASHALVDHLTELNTARKHGKRGRRVEYSPRLAGGRPHQDRDRRRRRGRLDVGVERGREGRRQGAGRGADRATTQQRWWGPAARMAAGHAGVRPPHPPRAW